MQRREVAVIRHRELPSASYAVQRGGKSSGTEFCVRYRQRAFWGWGPWLKLLDVDRTYAWPYEQARALADQALLHGVIPGEYSHEAHAIIELDEIELDEQE